MPIGVADKIPSASIKRLFSLDHRDAAFSVLTDAADGGRMPTWSIARLYNPVGLLLAWRPTTN